MIAPVRLRLCLHVAASNGTVCIGVQTPNLALVTTLALRL